MHGYTDIHIKVKIVYSCVLCALFTFQEDMLAMRCLLLSALLLCVNAYILLYFTYLFQKHSVMATKCIDISYIDLMKKPRPLILLEHPVEDSNVGYMKDKEV
jgi:hypothetical protein